MASPRFRDHDVASLLPPEIVDSFLDQFQPDSILNTLSSPFRSPYPSGSGNNPRDQEPGQARWRQAEEDAPQLFANSHEPYDNHNLLHDVLPALPTLQLHGLSNDTNNSHLGSFHWENSTSPETPFSNTDFSSDFLPTPGGLPLSSHWNPAPHTNHHNHHNYHNHHNHHHDYHHPLQLSSINRMTSGTPSNAPQLPNSNPNINNTFPPNRRQAAQLQPWHLPAAPVTDPYIADDPYLSLLATDHFSSPSLPPLNSSPLPSRARANLPKPLEVGDMPGATPSRRRGSAGGGIVDLTKEEPHADISGIDPNTPIMPPITRRRAAVQQQSGSSAAASRKRRHSSTSSSRKSPARPKSKRKATTTRRNSISSPFSDDEPPEAADESHDSIDLTNATEVPPELLVPKPDKRTKLGKFQCVICMDDVTALTVTHCGHLFCSECLHSALHIDSVKKVCPVCRTKVDLNKKAKNAKSFYHLELKVVTATKKGKRPAG